MDKKVLCFECGSKDEYELRETVRKYDGDGYSFEIKVEVPFCNKCGAPIMIEEIEDKIAKKANEKIRTSKGLITKGELLLILEKYNVSQKFLSKLLGWGEITLTRYVSGGYTPNASNSEKLKELNNPYVVQKLLDEKVVETNGKVKEEKAFQKLQIKVNEGIEKIEDIDGRIYQVVNWFLCQSSEENPITHLALQKLLFFSQSWSKVLTGKWLFDDECEAWAHGAVYPNIYNKFKKFRYLPLPKVVKNVALNKDELEVLECIKQYYFEIYNAKTLETICHLEEPYMVTRRGYKEGESCDEVIKKEYIEQYYGKISGQYGITMKNLRGIKVYLNNLLI